MATYVLIAGAWHGSWCWVEVATSLKALGHRVLTPDLLGTIPGDHPETVEPLVRWTDQIAEILEQEKDIILVGHSRAGAVISAVAERVPNKIRLLVYLAAYLLGNGQAVNDWARSASNAAAMANAVIFDEDGTCSLKPGYHEALFYNQTPARLIELARRQTVPEPIAAFLSPIQISSERFGSVRLSYIECLQDRAVPLEIQREMQASFPDLLIQPLDCDHSPFLSSPDQLVITLEKLGASV